MAVEYICSNCNYKFKVQSDRTLSACPYCGKPKTLRTLNRGPGKAEKLIQDA
ncbi:MAG: hypothetical protein KKD17_04045 [Nanoarchaeota archaeon]|nr:hypothetical protein [Nanoarchaeota archaeon]